MPPETERSQLKRVMLKDTSLPVLRALLVFTGRMREELEMGGNLIERNGQFRDFPISLLIIIFAQVTSFLPMDKFKPCSSPSRKTAHNA